MQYSFIHGNNTRPEDTGFVTFMREARRHSAQTGDQRDYLQDLLALDGIGREPEEVTPLDSGYDVAVSSDPTLPKRLTPACEAKMPQEGADAGGGFAAFMVEVRKHSAGSDVPDDDSLLLLGDLARVATAPQNRGHRSHSVSNRRIGIPGRDGASPSVKEVVRDLAAALDRADLEDGNRALGRFVALVQAEAARSVLCETGSDKDSRVDDVADDAATDRAVAFYSLLETVNATDAEIDNPEEVASWLVRTTLDDVRGFRRKDGRKVPPRVRRLSARNRPQREKSLDAPIALQTAPNSTMTLADSCADTKTRQPWQVSALREELTQWREVAETHGNRTVREILPDLLELWRGCGSEICPLDLYEIRLIDPPRVDRRLLDHMGDVLTGENSETLSDRVREIRWLLDRFELVEPRGIADELRARINGLLFYAKRTPESECSLRHRKTIGIVVDYLLLSLAKEEFQLNSAANVTLPSLLLDYRCRVNPAVIDYLEERSGRRRDTLQKCLKRLKDILLSDPSSVLRKSNPASIDQPEA